MRVPPIITDRWIRQRVEESKAAFIKQVVRRFPGGWTTEDRLPSGMSDADYTRWFDQSAVVNGIRIGPLVAATTPPATEPGEGRTQEGDCSPRADTRPRGADIGGTMEGD